MPAPLNEGEENPARTPCPHCGSETEVPDPDGGYTVCSSCGREFIATGLLSDGSLQTLPRRRLAARRKKRRRARYL